MKPGRELHRTIARLERQEREQLADADDDNEQPDTEHIEENTNAD